MEIHPQIIQKDGKNEFVVIPYEEFILLRDKAEDYEDLKDLREAKSVAEDAPGITLNETIKELGIG